MELFVSRSQLLFTYCAHSTNVSKVCPFHAELDLKLVYHLKILI